MIYGILFTLLVLDCIVLGAAILLQSGKGSGMAASFGGASSSADAVLGVRQAGNFLTAASWWAGGIFLVLSFTLSMMSTRNRLPASVLDQPATTQSAPVPAASQTLPLQPAPANTAPAGSAPATTSPAPRQ
ncbi:MAG: preprotein translocase subunit SecG [Gemmatimonadaceae bacterium]|nr:preprotein translocase subunit SecG [Gemmatimonadaceae bacterium]NUQ93417.1 preprotein translocase subunit SecG [Gemmatimonadaceae bacterium]NUR20126.1 preprotein translocase subunit SecG [Gemmatimonadaceae bacterium]